MGSKKLRSIEGGEKVEVTNEIFRPGAGPFMMVWGKVSGYDKYPAALLMKMVKIGKAFEAAHLIWQETWKKLVDQYAKKDAAGKIEPMKGQDGQPKPNTFEIAPEHQEAWEKALNELDEVPVEVDVNKIALGGVLGAGMLLSPQEVMILDGLISHDGV